MDYEVLKKTPDAFDVELAGCRYARLSDEIGAPELGFLLVLTTTAAGLP